MPLRSNDLIKAFTENDKFVVDSNGVKSLELDGKKYPCTGYIGQVKSGYMCQNDFQHEVGDAPATGPVCDSVESLVASHPCVKECGWVRVLLIAVEHGDARESEEETKQEENQTSAGNSITS